MQRKIKIEKKLSSRQRFPLPICVFSQKDSSQVRSEIEEDCFGITKYDDEYIIRLNGVDYNDKDKAFICESDLITDII